MMSKKSYFLLVCLFLTSFSISAFATIPTVHNTNETYYTNNTGQNTVDGFTISLTSPGNIARYSGESSGFTRALAIESNPAVTTHTWTFTADNSDLATFNLDQIRAFDFSASGAAMTVVINASNGMSQTFTTSTSTQNNQAMLNTTAGLFDSISSFSVSLSLSGRLNSNALLAGFTISNIVEPIFVNTPPIIINAPASVTVVEDVATDIGLSTIVFFDNEANPLTTTFTAASGTLATALGNGTFAGVTVSGSGTAALVLAGSSGNLNTFLDITTNVRYTTALNNTTATSITITGNDGDGGDLTTNPSITVNITAVNDAPTIAGVPASVTVAEDVATAIDLSASTFADAEDDSLTVTLTAASGTLATVSGNGASGGVTVSGSGTAALVLAGNPANLNTFLDTATNVRYTTALNNTTATSITITGNDGDGGDLTTNPSITVNITAVNDAPTIAGVPASVTVAEDVATDVDLSASTFADVEDDSLTVTLTAASGTLATASGNGVSGGVTVSGSGTAALVLAGNPANLNTFLDITTNVRYTTALNNTTATSITITGNDGDGGDLTTNPSITVNITAVNDAPTIAGVPASVTVAEDVATAIDLSASTFADVEDDSLTVTLTAASGTLATVSGNGASGGVTVSGSGTAALVLAGNPANLNTFLDTATNVRYTTALNNTTATSITITGNDGDGGDLTTNPSITVNITAVNDAPTIAGVPASVTVAEDVATDVDLSASTFADVEDDSLTVTLTAASGTLATASGNGSSGGVTVSGSGTAALVLAGNPANLNTFLDTATNVRYTTALNNTTATSITVTGNDGNGGDLTTSPSITVNITAVNDAPTIAGTPATVTVVENVATAINLSSSTFADAEDDTLTVTLTAASGTLAIASGNGSSGGVTVSGSGTAALQLVGNPANLNTFLDTATNVRYTTALNNTTATSITVTGNDGNGGTLTTNPSIVVNIAVAESDVPVLPTDTTLTVTATANSLAINWNAVTDVNSVIYAVTLTDTITNSTQTLSVSATSATFNDLVPGHPHTISVVATDALGNRSNYPIMTFSTLSVVDADNDGLADSLQSADSSATDSDADGISDDVEAFIGNGADVTQTTDTNNNGIPDVVEVGIGLNPAVSDHGTASVGDSRPVISNLSTPANAISTAIFTSVSAATASNSNASTSATLTVPASAYFRTGRCAGAILPANFASACQAVQRDNNNNLLLLAGAHSLWWIAVDSNGNWPLGGAVAQAINVVPKVSFSSGNIMTNGTATVVLTLNGAPVDLTRTLEVPYRITANSTGSSTNAVNSTGTFSFAPGQLNSRINLPVGTSAGSIVLQINSSAAVFVQNPANITAATERVTLGANSTQTINVISGNIAPQTSLTVVDSNNRAVSSVLAGSTISITAIAIDANGDTLTYDWSASTGITVPTNTSTPSFTATLQAGVATVILSVSDGVATVRTQLQIRVLATDPLVGVAANSDRDNDGLVDSMEGFADDDGDRVPNFIERLHDTSQLLPIDTTESRFVTSEPGVGLRLGNIAFTSAVFGSSTTTGFNASVVPQAQNGAGSEIIPADTVPHVGNIVDFEVVNLPVAGQQINVVIPLSVSIPVNPIYRKYLPVALAGSGRSSWVNFDTTTVNSNGARDALASTMSIGAGICPDYDDTSWQSGLVVGNNCLRLTITDGGPNDADNAINNEIADPAVLSGQMATLANSSLTLGASSLDADGRAVTSITVRVADMGGNPMSGVTVTLSQSGTAVTLSSLTDNNDGSYTAQLTAGNQAGNTSISARVDDGTNSAFNLPTAQLALLSTQAPVASTNGGGGGGMAVFELAGLLMMLLLSFYCRRSVR